ncbi:transcobalamin-2-like isoform X2 [Anguilla rostrata]|uniref:transcobalamin-2-like isoform X2 n=1 Tax=Anguilla rostrata TaxID=7938 RepID=UPI0030D43C0F
MELSVFHPGHDQGSNITLTVFDSFTNFNRTYPAHTAYRGSLLGAMKRLQDADPSFTFNTTKNFDYGPYLVIVNGLEAHDNVYWEILVEYKNGTIIRTNVGIGCYLPENNEHVVLKFTKW